MEGNRVDNLNEVKKKIVNILKFKGPSLPVHVAKQTGQSMLFSSAFLSELVSEKQVRISNMKVGGSPLYYIPGQEASLEKFSNFLNGKEKEAFNLLKERELIREDKLEPAIRVALRSIKDFAFPILVNLDNKQIVFWRFHSLIEEEAKKRIEEIFHEKRIPEKSEVKEEKKPEEVKKEIKKVEKEEIKEKPEIKKKEIKEEIEKPLLEIKETKLEKKEKPDSDFVLKVRSFLARNNIEILDELEKKKRELVARVRIDSNIGKIEFLCIAKDKKRVSDNDLTLALDKARREKRPALFISSGELNNKGKEYLDNWNNLIRFGRM